MSVNKVILIGRLGQDPEERTFQNGGRVCNFTVATSERWKDKDTGEQREKTEWHKIAITAEPLVNFATGYLRKGSRVYIEGQLETRKWQASIPHGDGKERLTTEIALRPYKGVLQLLDKAEGQGAGRGRRDDPSTVTANNRGPNPPTFGGGMDDEIPF